MPGGAVFCSIVPPYNILAPMSECRQSGVDFQINVESISPHPLTQYPIVWTKFLNCPPKEYNDDIRLSSQLKN